MMSRSTVSPEFNSVGTLWRPFLRFVAPLMLTNILQSLSGTINTIFVGQMLGVKAVAAVAVFAPMLFFLLAFVIGVASGSTILIGQAWGAKNLELVSKITGNSLAIIGILGVVVAILGSWGSAYAIQLIGVPPDIQAEAIRYAQVMFGGIPLLFWFIAYTSLMRGVGDSVTPLLAVIVSILIGVVVTPLLIRGGFGLPSLGIRAPAIATILSQACVLAFLVVYGRHKQHPLQFNRQLFRQIKIQPSIAKQVINLGLPTAIQMMTGAISGLVIMGLVNGFGSQATAAYGAINQVLSYVQFPAMSIAIATSIFAAQAIGAGKTSALNCVTRTALLTNLVLTGGLIIIAYVFSRYLMAMFITDDAVIALGQQLLHIVLWSILFISTSMIFSGMMRATGMVWLPMLLNVGCIALVEIPAAIGLSRHYGLAGIWWAYALNFTLMCIVQGLYYQLVWKQKTVQRLV